MALVTDNDDQDEDDDDYDCDYCHYGDDKSKRYLLLLFLC